MASFYINGDEDDDLFQANLHSDDEWDELAEAESQKDANDFLDLPEDDVQVQEDEGPHCGIGMDLEDEIHGNSQEEEDGHYTLSHTYPRERDVLQQELKGEYTCPDEAPLGLNPPRELNIDEKLSLQHYIAWQKSNGTELAYKLHAQVLQEGTQVEILPLHAVKKLAMDLSGLRPYKIDICPNSCIAYTGAYSNLTNCPYVKDKDKCNEPRYKRKSKPRAQMIYLSCFDVIKAMYANVQSSTLLRHRDRLLQKVISVLHEGINSMNTDSKKYSDFGDSAVQEHLYSNVKLFRDGRDIALALSTDGAQLAKKKLSNTWIVLLILLNLPAEIRYKTNNTLVPFIVPGPNSPGDLESFLHPLFVDMAKASEGIWMWDAVESSSFVHHAYICMVLGDMLGSAKLNGMAGHTAVHGDRFSMVSAARSSKKKGAKYLYYPVSPPDNENYNPTRPPCYDLDKLPIRTEDKYWEIIEKLSSATSKAQYNEIVRMTGISCMPLTAASPAFIHPSFFPLDPFHIFFENIMPLMWDTWTTLSKAGDPVHISKEKAEAFGCQVVEGMKTLPPLFCGPVQDPNLKRQSQYKAFEWMALLYWFILPIGIELEFDHEVLHNFSCLVEIVEFAMTIKERSEDELETYQKRINDFLCQYESLYVGNDPEKILRCKLCIFQLVHVPMHIRWYGSIRLGSQATVERTIGEAGHKIHSKKSPFANMANIFFQKELTKVLLLYYPNLHSNTLEPEKKKSVLFGKIRIEKQEKTPGNAYYDQLSAIFESCIQLGEFNPMFPVNRWGKCNLTNGTVLSSELSETSGEQPKRSRCHFEARINNGSQPIFGKALAFFEFDMPKIGKKNHCVVVFQELNKMVKTLKLWRGEWSQQLSVMEVSHIVDIIGVWSGQIFVYPLRKHPSLAWMSEEEKGIGSGLDGTSLEEVNNEQ